MSTRNSASTVKSVVTNLTAVAAPSINLEAKACEEMRSAINKNIFVYQIIIGGLGLLSLLLLIVYVLLVCYFRKKM